MGKYICFRFDVDTHVGLSRGVPNLLQLAQKHQVNFTFFLCMGKSFHRPLLLKERFQNLFKNKTSNYSFPIQKKIGLALSVETIFKNPHVGISYPSLLEQIEKENHEIGLHGGRNHALWEHHACHWKEERLVQEISFGLKALHQLELPQPTSFASPCWESPVKLPKVLSDAGISVLADIPSKGAFPKKDAFGMHLYPTNITGKQEKVGFLENLRFHGYSNEEIIFEFENQLEMPGEFKMVFDHPIYAGIYEIDILSKMIKVALKKGYKIDSLKNIASNFSI